MAPIVLLSSAEHQCVTFVWPDDLSTYVGYRFVEHQPTLTRRPLAHETLPPSPPPPAPNRRYPRGSDWLDNWQTTYDAVDDPLQLQFQTLADGSAVASVMENEGLQERVWRFVPEEEGVRMWMTLTTHEEISGAYIAQQCLRFTAGIGTGFRRKVARTPFLSELLMQVLGNANGTMTWSRRFGGWQPFPVPFTRYHTEAGAGVYEDTAGLVDIGLIVRESASREAAPPSYWQTTAPNATWESWTAGLYWERTAMVSNRHPADCLHAGVDFGPLAAGESRTVQGKFYWMEGTKADLFARWREEFDPLGEQI